MVAAMVVCTYIGYYIDSKIGNDKQYWTLGGMLLGLFYAGYEVWKVVRALNKNEKKIHNHKP